MIEIAYGIVLVSNIDNKVLLVQHKEGHRGFPKGHTEKGEKGVETALRELKEETGIKPNYIISNIKLTEKYKTKQGNKKVSYFIGYTNRKNVILNKKELINFNWESLEEIRRQPCFLSNDILSKLEKSLCKKQVLKYNTKRKKYINLEYKLQGSKHAYSRVCPLSYFSDKISFTNIPNILDVGILDEIKKISNLSNKHIKIPHELSGRSRSIIPLLPGLIYKHNKIELNQPKGCEIGKRKIDLYLDILKFFGNEVILYKENIIIIKKNHKPIVYDFPFPSFSGTSIAISHAAFIKGKTILRNISIEPEIIYLIDTLRKIGAKINFTGERDIEIDGFDFNKIKKKIIFKIPEDRNVLITKLALSIYTRRDFYYKGENNLYLTPFLQELEKLGVNFTYNNYYISIPHEGKRLRPINVIANFYPGLCSDWQPIISLLLTKIEGKSVIIDSIFENRYNYIRELSKILNTFSYKISGNKLEITGKGGGGNEEKKGNKLLKCLDLRSGAVNVLSCFASKTDNIKIDNVVQINRGYENIIGDIYDVLGTNYLSYEYE